MHMDGLVHCKNCNAIFEFLGVNTTFNCGVCTSLNCIPCRTIHHLGETCDQFGALQNLRRAIDAVFGVSVGALPLSAQQSTAPRSSAFDMLRAAMAQVSSDGNPCTFRSLWDVVQADQVSASLEALGVTKLKQPLKPKDRLRRLLEIAQLHSVVRLQESGNALQVQPLPLDQFKPDVPPSQVLAALTKHGQVATTDAMVTAPKQVSVEEGKVDQLQDMYYAATVTGVDESHAMMKEAEALLASFPRREAHYLQSPTRLAAAAIRDEFWLEVFGHKKLTCQSIVDMLQPQLGATLHAEMIISPALLMKFIQFRKSLSRGGNSKKQAAEIAYHGCGNLANLASIRMHGLVVPGHSAQTSF